MDRDGGNCRVGVRRLAEVTGLNKSTVAEHRSHAVEAGWLIASSNSSRSVKREIVAAIPDTIATEHIKKLSGAAGQPQAKSLPQLYGFSLRTVRPRRTYLSYLYYLLGHRAQTLIRLPMFVAAIDCRCKP
jgi:hypothetical protein